MKYFISYKFTDIPRSVLHSSIGSLVEVLKAKKHEVFCNLYSDEHYVKNKCSVEQIMKHCFAELLKCDVYIAYVDPITGNFGGGSAIECGYAIATNKKIIAIIPDNGMKYTSLIGLADKVLLYKNSEDMLAQLATANIEFKDIDQGVNY